MVEELGLEAAACAARLPELRAMAEVRNTNKVVDLFHTFPVAQLIQPPCLTQPLGFGGKETSIDLTLALLFTLSLFPAGSGGGEAGSGQ